jgi:hypothetical protein
VKGYPIRPGVIDPGHDAPEGWHPGRRADCLQCQPIRVEPKPKPKPSPVTIHFDGRSAGSDCKTGKRQFATRKAAMGAYHSLHRSREGLGPQPFRCAWCLCWHVGNRRGNASKARGRR